MNVYFLPLVLLKKRFQFVRWLLHLLFFDESGDFNIQLYFQTVV